MAGLFSLAIGIKTKRNGAPGSGLFPARRRLRLVCGSKRTAHPWLAYARQGQDH